MIASQRKHITGTRRAASPKHRVSNTYRVFDIPIRSLIPLPELPECQAPTPAITVRPMAASAFDPTGFASCHEWRNEQGQLICRCARRDADYLLSFPRQADFFIAASGTINCLPAPGVDEGLLRHLLLNQVLPRYLGHTGELLLHASAVALPNGATVAFIGRSGYGKSTIASCCHMHGASIVDDDCILLRHDARGVHIAGGVPTLRLYPDSLRALGYDRAGFAPYAAGTPKLQASLEQATPATSPRRLQALFLLGAPGDAAADGAVSILPAGGQAAMMALLESTFQLNPSDKPTQLRTFEYVAQTLAVGLPVYHLNYPRNHAALPRVWEALRDGSHT